MSGVHVADMGAVTALGMGPEALWEGLRAGRSGLAPVQRFATDNYVCGQAGCIAALDAEPPDSRLDRLIEMVFDGIDTVPADTALFTASTKGGIDQLERAVRGQKTNLDRILGHQIADLVAGRLGSEGPPTEYQRGLCLGRRGDGSGRRTHRAR